MLYECLPFVKIDPLPQGEGSQIQRDTRREVPLLQLGEGWDEGVAEHALVSARNLC